MAGVADDAGAHSMGLNLAQGFTFNPDLENPLRWMNNLCKTANAGISNFGRVYMDDAGNPYVDLVALRNVTVGEELTLAYYLFTENYPKGWHMDCACGECSAPVLPFASYPLHRKLEAALRGQVVAHILNDDQETVTALEIANPTMYEAFLEALTSQNIFSIQHQLARQVEV